MKDLLITSVDTLLLFLSPFAELYADKETLLGIIAAVVIAIGVMISAEIKRNVHPNEMANAMVAGLWIALLFYLHISAIDDTSIGFIGILIIMISVLVRFLDGMGFANGFSLIATRLSLISLGLVSLYCLYIFTKIDVYQLSLSDKIFGILHIFMLFITLTGIWHFIWIVAEGNEQRAWIYYSIFAGAFFFVQFINVSEYREDGVLYDGMYYMYLAAFPLGVALGFFNKNGDRVNST